MQRSLAIVAATVGGIIMMILLERMVIEEPQEACWFLSNRAETVLIEDLAAWAAHMEHADATMEDYYSVRIPEMLELWSTSGITETEARDCLLSLQVRRKSLGCNDLGIP